jgi:hypothetical protein
MRRRPALAVRRFRFCSAISATVRPESSDMVPFGEPFFMALDADVEVVPVMKADDLQKGFGKLG